MPIPYKERASFNRSQFSSVIVCPVAIPRICVCTATEVADVHTSWLLITMLGALAVGGVLSTVVVPVTVDVTVLLCAIAVKGASTSSATNKYLYIICNRPLLLCIHVQASVPYVLTTDRAYHPCCQL